MNCTLTISLAVLLQLDLGRTALHVNLSSVIPVAAFFTFEPDIFSLGSLGHNHLSKHKHPFSAQNNSMEKRYKKVLC